MRRTHLILRGSLLAVGLLVAALASPARAQVPGISPPDPELGSASTADSSPSVLVLIPVQPGRPVFDLLTRGVVGEFLRAPGPRVDVFVEYLYDLAASPDLADQQAGFLRAKYASRSIDAIVAFQHPAYLRIREALGLAPTVPIIFGTLDHVERPHGVALVEVAGDEADSFARVAQWLAQPEVVALVGGSSPGDRMMNAGLREKLDRVAPGRVIDLTGVAFNELPDRVARLSERAVVVVGTVLADSRGQPMSYPMMMKALAPVTRGPIVVGHDLQFGLGALGGWLLSFEELGQEAAKLALEVLHGTPVDALATRVVPLRPTFDARQLRRFGIDESRLPAEARILFREPTRWQAYRRWLVVGVSALAIQSALIFGLFVERRRRHESEMQLASRATRQALIADVSSEFATLTHGDLDAAIAANLARVGTVLEVRECALWAIDRETPPRLVTRWHAEAGHAPMLDQRLVADAAPRLMRGDVVHVDQASGVILDASTGLEQGDAAALLLPLRVDGDVMGILSVRHARTRAWSAQVADDLRTVGEIIATAVVRKRTDASIRTQLQALTHVNRVAGLGELAASLAHQLNQPLAAILSNAEVAHHLLARPDPPVEDVREILADVIADNERAGGIISHMRAMLRKQQVQPTIVDVNAAVRRVTSLVAHDARLRGSSLDVHLGDALPLVRMDSTQLKQVLLNLVVNATDAMTSVTSRRPVELRTMGREGGVLIETRDHGAGIPPEAMHRLFDPFFTTKADGLGVGLSIARSIVEAAGGRISAQNDPAGGAVFRVWLPGVELLAD